MQRGLPRRLFKLLLRRVRFCDTQVISYRTMEQLRILRHEALQPPQAAGIQAPHILSGQGDPAAVHIPEAHQQLQKGRLAAAALAVDADDPVLWKIRVHIRKNRLRVIGKPHMLRGGSRKLRIQPVCHILHHRRFLQDVQHPVAAGKGMEQIAGQARQGDHRAEGAHHSHGPDQHLPEAGRALPVQPDSQKQHEKGKAGNDTAGQRRTQPGILLHLLLFSAQRFRPAPDLRKPCLLPAELQRLAQAPQAVQEKAVKIPEFIPVSAPRIPAQPGDQPGHEQPHQQIAAGSRQAHERMQPVKESQHQRAGNHRDQDRGNRMRIKHLQQLDIAGDNGDQVALFLCLQLCRRQPAQRAENFIPDQRQQMKGNVMIAELLSVMQDSPQDAADHNQNKQRGNRQGRGKTQNGGQGLRPEHIQKDRAQETGYSQKHRQHHHRQQRPHQADQLQHHLHAAAPDLLRICRFRHYASPPFPPSVPAASGPVPAVFPCRPPAAALTSRP